MADKPLTPEELAKYGATVITPEDMAKYGITLAEPTDLVNMSFAPTPTPTPPAAAPIGQMWDAAASSFGLPQNSGDVGAVIRGGVQGVASPVTMIADPLTQLYNLVTGGNQLPPSEGLQRILTVLGVKEPQTEAQKVLQAGTAGLTGGGVTVLAGKAASVLPGMLGAAGKVMATQPIQQMAGGAVGNMSSESARALGAPPLVQMGAGLAGGMVGASAAGIKAMPTPPGPVAEAEKAGVRLMTSDVRPPKNPLTKTAQAFGEIVGTSSDRYKQQQQRATAVENIVREFSAGDKDVALAGITRDLIAKRKGLLDKFGAQKDEVIDKLSYPLDPVMPVDTPTPQQPLGITGTELATTPRGQVGQPLNVPPTPTAVGPSKIVPMPATTQKIDDSIAHLEQLSPEMYAAPIKLLNTWKTAIQNQDLRNIEDLRAAIGAKFAAPELADVKTETQKILNGVYPAVNEDMGNYIKANGGQADFNKWKVANTTLSAMMDELKLSVLQKALNRGEVTPELSKNMLFSQDSSTMRSLYNGLTDKGRAWARAALMSKAAVAEDGSILQPAQYLANVKKLSKEFGIFFTGENLEEVKGLQRVFEATTRADVATKPNLASGFKSTLMLPMSFQALSSMFGPGIEGMAKAAAAGAAVGGWAKLYESTAMRKLLTALPKLARGSPEEAMLLKRIISVAENINAPTPGERTNKASNPVKE